MDNYKFKSLEELYQRLLPAFTTKVNEFKRDNINNIHEKDIWNYLKNNIWINRKELTLGEMVNDILTTKLSDVQNYLINVRKQKLDKTTLL